MAADEQSELAAEQAWLDHAAACLATMVTTAAATRRIIDRAVEQERTADARVAQRQVARRQHDLQIGSGPLCFGRIETEGPAPTRPGERWYVGRRHIEDDNGEPVVVDWRAPVSVPFYRATGVDPCGLVHRRRFSIDAGRVLALFDEDLTDPESGSAGGLPDPLLAELGRSRTGQMRDIVATIAAEQDRVIRADLDELLIVQGGPGTGKTAVGLHRAAFLLFGHRAELTESKVLVVGPNPLFLRYISDVLPSLGESSVVQTTAERLLAGRFPVRGTDRDDVLAIKGSLRMATVIANAIAARISVPAEGIELRAGLSVVRFDQAGLSRLQATALERSLPSNDGREVFRQLVLQEAWRRHAERPGVDPGSQPSFVAAVRNDPRFTKEFDRMWPTLAAPAVLRDLFGSPKRLAVAAEGILDPEEQALIRRKPAKKSSDEPWTSGDMALLDEAGARTSGVPVVYGHVVVDEAQDHSAMTLRMLGRRARRGSMTVLGDLAQATSPVAVGSWEAALDALTGDRSIEARRVELTVGYRVPALVLDFANRLLPQAAPEVTPARSIRPGGAPPQIIRVEPGPEGHELGRAVVAELAVLRDQTTSVAVVGVDADLDRVARALDQAQVPNERVGRSGLPGPDAVALVDPEGVKGLEFDAVLVLEPAAIVSTTNGLRRLYVSLTRAVQHLVIVHSLDLPPSLDLPSIDDAIDGQGSV